MRHFLRLPVLLLITSAAMGQRTCPFASYQQAMVTKDPGMVSRVLEVENFTRRRLESQPLSGNKQDQEGGVSVIMVPVVVHVVYNNDAQNISDAQVLSQIAVLNKDYGKHNADTAEIPSYYSGLAADCGFQFALAHVDTNGNATTGIVRKHTLVQSFSINDDIKFTAQGGDDGWDPDRYLNIWVGNLSGGVLGYSSIVGGPAANDGVTVVYTAFGTLGTATAPFNLGRTTTHEIGHWLNLIHTWGDALCGNDQVADTPPQQGPTYGDPEGIVISCNNTPDGNMYMNYMDFTDDIGMHMFTYGQRDRMRALFDPNGPRYPLLSSDALTAIPLNGPVETASASPPGANTVNVYPNPATGMVSVVFDNSIPTGSLLDVYNVVGQKVMTTRVTGNYLQIDISTLASGPYFLRVDDGRQQDRVTLIKH